MGADRIYLYVLKLYPYPRAEAPFRAEAAASGAVSFAEANDLRFIYIRENRAASIRCDKE